MGEVVEAEDQEFSEVWTSDPPQFAFGPRLGVVQGNGVNSISYGLEFQICRDLEFDKLAHVFGAVDQGFVEIEDYTVIRQRVRVALPPRSIPM